MKLDLAGVPAGGKIIMPKRVRRREHPLGEQHHEFVHSLNSRKTL